jgi:hypothetical protein
MKTSPRQLFRGLVVAAVAAYSGKVFADDDHHHEPSDVEFTVQAMPAGGAPVETVISSGGSATIESTSAPTAPNSFGWILIRSATPDLGFKYRTKVKGQPEEVTFVQDGNPSPAVMGTHIYGIMIELTGPLKDEYYLKYYTTTGHFNDAHITPNGASLAGQWSEIPPGYDMNTYWIHQLTVVVTKKTEHH